MDTFDALGLKDLEMSLHPPPRGAKSPELMEFLHAQLDALYFRKAEILGGLHLLGSSVDQRFQGGAKPPYRAALRQPCLQCPTRNVQLVFLLLDSLHYMCAETRAFVTALAFTCPPGVGLPSAQLVYRLRQLRFPFLSKQASMHPVGQAIVQMAKDRASGLDFAIKFFVSKRGFDAEAELYEDSPLGKFLPKVWYCHHL